MLTLRDEKNQLRLTYKQIRRQVPPDKKALLDRQICKHFLSLASYRYADTLLLYYPRPDEADTRPILQNALQTGKKVAFPRCFDGGKMEFYFITKESDLVEGLFGIPAPGPGCVRFDKHSLRKSTLMTVPGLAFDRKGYRLGYGKGYYDRYLSDSSIPAVGFAYSVCITDRLPRGRYDLPVDLIISEKGVTLI